MMLRLVMLCVAVCCLMTVVHAMANEEANVEKRGMCDVCLNMQSQSACEACATL